MTNQGHARGDDQKRPDDQENMKPSKAEMNSDKDDSEDMSATEDDNTEGEGSVSADTVGDSTKGEEDQSKM